VTTAACGGPHTSTGGPGGAIRAEPTFTVPAGFALVRASYAFDTTSDDPAMIESISIQAHERTTTPAAALAHEKWRYDNSGNGTKTDPVLDTTIGGFAGKEFVTADPKRPEVGWLAIVAAPSGRAQTFELFSRRPDARELSETFRRSVAPAGASRAPAPLGWVTQRMGTFDADVPARMRGHFSYTVAGDGVEIVVRVNEVAQPLMTPIVDEHTGEYFTHGDKRSEQVTIAGRAVSGLRYLRYSGPTPDREVFVARGAHLVVGTVVVQAFGTAPVDRDAAFETAWRTVLATLATSPPPR
jgi:hypothetical protein